MIFVNQEIRHFCSRNIGEGEIHHAFFRRGGPLNGGGGGEEGRNI